MTKRKTNTQAADDAADGVGNGNQPSVSSVIATEGDPSGENGPGGTNSGESGGQTGAAGGDVDHRILATSTEIVAGAIAANKLAIGSVTADKIGGELSPGEVLAPGSITAEKITSGPNAANLGQTNTPESDRTGEAGNLAGLATAVRKFELASAVRHNNRYFAGGQPVALTEDEHGPLWEAGIVDAWETGTPV